MTRKLSVAVAALVAALSHAPPASADSTATSTISQLKLIDAGDDNYRLYRGVLWLDVDKASTHYRWGGKYCGGTDLSDRNVLILFEAFREKYSVTLDYKTYRTRDGKTYRCVTAFTISRT